MKTLIYKGELATGYIEEPGTNHQFPFRAGEPVLLPDDLAASLLAGNGGWIAEAHAKRNKQSTEE